jgi:DNA-binding SARP family transcriptional activator
MTNKAWISHVKQFAFKNNIVYMEALKSLECQQLYIKKNKQKDNIKILRQLQNQLVFQFLDGIVPREEFKNSYTEINDKIKNKMSDSKRYRIKYKKTLKENNA